MCLNYVSVKSGTAQAAFRISCQLHGASSRREKVACPLFDSLNLTVDGLQDLFTWQSKHPKWDRMSMSHDQQHFHACICASLSLDLTAGTRAELLLLRSLPHSSTGVNKTLLNQMLREKPDRQFVRADHIAHQQVIRPIIASFGGLLGHRSGLKQNDLVRME